MGFGVWGLGFGVWGLGFGVWGLGFGVWGLGFGVWGLGFGVWGLGSLLIWAVKLFGTQLISNGILTQGCNPVLEEASVSVWPLYGLKSLGLGFRV